VAKASTKRPRAKKAPVADQVQENAVDATKKAPASATKEAKPDAAANETPAAVEDAQILDESATTTEAETSDAAPAAAQTRRGSAFLPLVVGGVVAAGLGYGAAYFGGLPTQGGSEEAASDVSGALEGQAQDLADLIARTESLEAATNAASGADLTEVNARIDALSTQVEGTTASLGDLAARLEALEARPSFVAGEGGSEDVNAMAAALSQIQAALETQQAANTAMTEEIRNLASEAETRISEVEQRAQAQVGNVTAQAALSQLRLAMDSGAPFATALNDAAASAGIEVPAALQAVSQTGVARLEELQMSFPSLARNALPVALRETAGEGAMDRIGAFFMGQVGGRSLTPQDGDDPDAVLSRAEDAVRRGALDEALTEIAALPEPVQAIFADWVAEVQSRLDAAVAVDGFANALGGGN